MVTIKNRLNQPVTIPSGIHLPPKGKIEGLPDSVLEDPSVIRMENRRYIETEKMPEPKPPIRPLEEE